MAKFSAQDLPLNILICDANRGSAATLEQAIKQFDVVHRVKSVHTLEDAKAASRERDLNIIFVDPLSFSLDEASSFIFSTRKSLPEIVFVLYLDKMAAERQRAEFYNGERRRFSHYYELDKQTPISSLEEELSAVLHTCQFDLSWRMSTTNLERLKKQTIGLAKSSATDAERHLVEQVEKLLKQITPALANRVALDQGKKVFLSHRFAEKEFVEGLTRLLQQSGFEVVTGQAANTYISKAIIERIRECDYFLCLMTRDAKKDDGTYTTSAWLLEEKGVALALGRPIVLMIEEGVTDFGGLQGDWQRLHFGDRGFLTAALQAVEQLKSYSGRSGA
jgi:nucleoside 2-deoxyribosyltransferase